VYSGVGGLEDELVDLGGDWLEQRLGPIQHHHEEEGGDLVSMALLTKEG